MKLTACLLFWRRHYHLREIVEHLLSQSQIAQVAVWFNEHEPSEELQSWMRSRENVYWAHSVENIGTLGRFAVSNIAPCDAVFFQDDDLLVYNIDALEFEYERLGRSCIVANCPDQPQRGRCHWSWRMTHKPLYVDLGFGSIVPTAWCGNLQHWPGERELLVRKADKIFTVTHEWSTIRAGHDDVVDLVHEWQVSGRDKHALSRRKDHNELTEQAVAEALAWKQTLNGAS